MWLVRVALERPYTFVVLALLVLIMSAVATSSTPTDIRQSDELILSAKRSPCIGLRFCKLSRGLL
jgi:hypothetical protein